MIKFPDSIDAPSVKDIVIEAIMNDIQYLENQGRKIIRVEGNYALKAFLFPDETFEDYIPRNASYELGTLYTDEIISSGLEYPKYRIVVEEVTEIRWINFGD
jgi:hypothetical protein